MLKQADDPKGYGSDTEWRASRRPANRIPSYAHTAYEIGGAVGKSAFCALLSRCNAPDQAVLFGPAKSALGRDVVAEFRMDHR